MATDVRNTTPKQAALRRTRLIIPDLLDWLMTCSGTLGWYTDEKADRFEGTSLKDAGTRITT